MKKLTAILLVTITIFSMVSPVAATVTPRYTYTETVSAYIDIDTTSGVAHCRGDCVAYDAVKVEVKVYLQRYNESTSSWDTLKTWVAENTGIAAVDAYYSISSGYKYRVRTVGYVYNSDGTLVETVSASDYANFFFTSILE